MQQHQITPEKLRSFAQNKNLRSELRDKLKDLALLHENYSRWLDENKLKDANCLLDFATDELRKTGVAASRQSAAILKKSGGLPTAATIQHLWLDGFDGMNPPEFDLLSS